MGRPTWRERRGSICHRCSPTLSGDYKRYFATRAMMAAAEGRSRGSSLARRTEACSESIRTAPAAGEPAEITCRSNPEQYHAGRS